MEPFNTKIGTPKSVYFREYDACYRYTDLDLEARFAMNVDISEYDCEKYKEASEVVAAIKSNPMELFQKCMNRLPEGKSVVKGFETLIPEAMEAVLSDMGITAKTQIFAFKLTEESEKDYREMMRHERSLSESDYNAPDSVDGVCLDAQEAEFERMARESGLYKLIYKNYGVAGFSSEKKFYAPRDSVEVIYRGIMSDTNYTFGVTAKDFDVKYDDRNFFRITFVMPEHDVEISYTAQEMRMYNTQNDNNTGFMGIMQQSLELQPGEWVCGNCGHKNTGGKFCAECGGGVGNLRF